MTIYQELQAYLSQQILIKLRRVYCHSHVYLLFLLINNYYVKNPFLLIKIIDSRKYREIM